MWKYAQSVIRFTRENRNWSTQQGVLINFVKKNKRHNKSRSYILRLDTESLPKRGAFFEILGRCKFFVV